MITIRPGEPEDAPALVEFQMRLARESEDLELDPAAVARGVGAVFEDPSRGRYWLAEDQGQIVGCLMTVPEWSDWRHGTVLWIHSLYVPPQRRRRGVFRALFAHLRRRVEADESLKGLRLYVDRRNRSAMLAYEAMGMDGRHYALYEWMKSEPDPGTPAPGNLESD